MNRAAAQLCLKNPSLLWSRGALLAEARVLVNDTGYVYKKGKSRSKVLNATSMRVPSPKRAKVSSEARLNRLQVVQQDLKDIVDRLTFKEKRRQGAEAVRNYKLCEELTEDISTLRGQKRELEAEQKILKKKSTCSKKYKENKYASSVSSGCTTSASV